MNAVLISTKPRWCAKIANGEKPLEVRKTRPKIETPFKCYIYQTKAGKVGTGLFTAAGEIMGRSVKNGKPNLMYCCEPTSELSIHFLCWHWQWQFRKGRNPIKAKSPIYCDEWNNDGSSHVNAAIVMSGVKSCDSDHHQGR